MSTLMVIGSGKMAEAIVYGSYKRYHVELVARDEKRLKEIQKALDNKIEIKKLNQISIDGKNVLLCVKPNALKEISSEIKGCAMSLISILAGIKIKELKKYIKSKYYIRAMPNLSATYQSSMTSLCGDESFKDEAIKIAQSFGKTIWLHSEKELDIATAIAGSGPAFLALVAEAMMDGGVKEGLKREDAKALVLGLFESFSPLLNDKHPAIIKDEVMSPAGTTAKGIATLEEGKVRDGFIKAISSAYKKTLE